MEKIYDVTDGLTHSYCKDIKTAREVLKAIYNRMKSDCPNISATLLGESEIKFYPSFNTGPLYYEIKQVDLYDELPYFLRMYTE